MIYANSFKELNNSFLTLLNHFFLSFFCWKVKPVIYILIWNEDNKILAEIILLRLMFRMLSHKGLRYRSCLDLIDLDTVNND